MVLVAFAILILAAVILFREEIRKFFGEVGQTLAVGLPLWLVWVWSGGPPSFQASVVIGLLAYGLVQLSAYMKRKTEGHRRELSQADKLRDEHERGVINDQQYEEALKAKEGE